MKNPSILSPFTGAGGVFRSCIFRPSPVRIREGYALGPSGWVSPVPQSWSLSVPPKTARTAAEPMPEAFGGLDWLSSPADLGDPNFQAHGIANRTERSDATNGGAPGLTRSVRTLRAEQRALLRAEQPCLLASSFSGAGTSSRREVFSHGWNRTLAA